MACDHREQQIRKLSFMRNPVQTAKFLVNLSLNFLAILTKSQKDPSFFGKFITESLGYFIKTPKLPFEKM